MKWPHNNRSYRISVRIACKQTWYSIYNTLQYIRVHERIQHTAIGIAKSTQEWNADSRMGKHSLPRAQFASTKWPYHSMCVSICYAINALLYIFCTFLHIILYVVSNISCYGFIYIFFVVVVFNCVRNSTYTRETETASIWVSVRALVYGLY